MNLTIRPGTEHISEADEGPSLTSLVKANFRSGIHRLVSLVPGHHYRVECLMDQRLVCLPFASLQDAVRFSRFVALYVGDAAPGNSYSAYFPASPGPGPDISSALFPAGAKIEEARLSLMARAICRARLALKSDERLSKDRLKVAPTISSDKNWYRFDFDEAQLPPRIAPSLHGDYVRVVDDPRFNRIDAYFVREVDGWSILAIPSSIDLPECVVVPASHLMKIRNHYKDSSAWWERHGHLHDEVLRRVTEYVESRLDGKGKLIGDFSCSPLLPSVPSVANF